jgi:hypothetical protein
LPPWSGRFRQTPEKAGVSAFHGTSRRGAIRSYNPRNGRPERAPNPSIDASVPSSAKSCSRTSRSLAKFCSLSSSPRARSASLRSLFNVRFFRCKARTWFHHCRTSSGAAPTRWYAGGHRTAFAAAEAPNLCANRPSTCRSRCAAMAPRHGVPAVATYRLNR